jgi:hypothetical protein
MNNPETASMEKRGCCPHCEQRLTLWQSAVGMRKTECRGCGYAIQRSQQASWAAIGLGLALVALFRAYGLGSALPWIFAGAAAAVLALWPRYMSRVTLGHD